MQSLLSQVTEIVSIVLAVSLYASHLLLSVGIVRVNVGVALLLSEVSPTPE